MSHLEVHRGVHCRGKRPLLALSPLAAGQSRQEPAPAFSPKAWLAFQNVSQHNEPLVCLSSLKLLPEQKDSRTSHGAHISSHLSQQDGWLRAPSQADTAPVSAPLCGGSFKRISCVLILKEFPTQNSIIFLHKNKYPHFVFFLSSSFRDNYFSLLSLFILGR